MIVFPIYAAIIWYLAARWRRRWPGFVAVIAGTAALFLFARLFYVPGEEMRSTRFQFLAVVWADALIILPVGLFIACLPHPTHDLQCRSCGYDLSDLDPVDLSCPECGADWRGKGSRFQPEEPLTPIPTGPPRRRTSL